MNLLVTGRGTSGSWAIRGEQLGRALSATVQREASKVKGYDLAIVVKRGRDDLLHRLHTAGVPIVWDIVDSWPQPAGNEWDAATCRQWLASQVERIKPIGIVASTKAMAADCKGFGVPMLTVPHHSRPHQQVNPIRERVQKIGYEGSVKYLGAWQAWFEVECASRKWSFVINPPHLADLDIVVAVRESTGYAARNWKSNVKLANAQGSGTPCILNREAGYIETATGGELFADTREDMVRAFDRLTDHETRKTAAAGLWPPTLEMVAADYREWLSKF